jgi:hypothetical protein
MEIWQENLEKAKHHFKVADHMLYVTFSLLKEKRLIIKILTEIYKSVNYLIKAILQHEYAFKRVPLYKDPKLNLKVFKEKIALRYINNEELNILIKILEIEKKHEKAPLEFVKKDKFVIFLGENYETLTIDKLKQYILPLKKLINQFKFN